MADISMKYSTMEAVAEQGKKLSTQFSELCTELEALVQGLDNQWEGAAQKEFATIYRELKPKLNSITKVLEAYSKNISAVAVSEQELDTSGKDLFAHNTLPSFQ